MPTEITLSEYQRLEAEYDKAYEAGLTAQRCAFCDELAIEKHANWAYGEILHHHCVVHWLQGEIASDWWQLGLGIICGKRWHPSMDWQREDYMAMFMTCLGYGRFA